MARGQKKKLICKMPQNDRFYSRGNEQAPEILMKVEEYECIRLIDYKQYTQEECAAQMQVSRATVQAIYAEARKKLARFLVEGIALRIEGGDYEIKGAADKKAQKCTESSAWDKKEEQIMRIAVTYEDGQVFQHFGHSRQFKVYDVEDGRIVKSEVVDTNGEGHCSLAGLLFEGGVNVLICGGIGGGARNALAEAGIQLFPGAHGDADAQVESFIAGNLNYDPNTVCSHHGSGHHGKGHTCGHHGENGGHCGHHSE